MNSMKVESGVQLFSRLNQRSEVTRLHPIIFTDGPFPNDVIEITGTAMTGKTSLITELLARCILSHYLNGKNCQAVLINADHHFDMLKLVSIMEMLIKDSSNILGGNIESVINRSLENLTILNCYDLQQLQLSFLNLQKIITDNLNIGLVVLDSLSTYYWEYRLSNGIISFQGYHSKTIENLKNVVQYSNVVTIFTKCEIEQTETDNSCILNNSYKITLKHVENKNIAVVFNNVQNVCTTFNYEWQGLMKFTPC